MTEKKETIYCGNGKEVKFDDGGSIINATIHLGKIKDHVYDYEGNKYVNVTIARNRDGAMSMVRLIMSRSMITSLNLRKQRLRKTYHFN